MNVDEISKAIAKLVEPVQGILASSAFVPDVLTPPHFYVAEWDIDFDVTFGDDSEAMVNLRLMVGHSGAQQQQALLKSFLRRSGPTSVKFAIEGPQGIPQTLNGLIDDLHVQKFRGHRLYTVGEKKFYGAEFVCRVIGTQDADA